MAGTVLGALAGLGFGAWEAMVLQAAGVEIALGEGQNLVPAIYAAVGAVLGLLAGASGLWGGRWALAGGILLVGWLIGGRMGTTAAAAAAPGVLGVAIPFGAALVLGHVAGRMPGPGWLHQGIGGFLLSSAALVAPLHHHLLAGGGMAGAVATGVALLFGAALGGVSAAAAAEGHPPLLPLIAWSGLGALGAWGTRIEPPPMPDGSFGKPPVLLVIASGLRADATGLGGDKVANTPRLDRLARSATAFRDAHANSNWSAPSIASILSGRLPYGHGCGLNNGRGPTGTPVRPDVLSLPAAMRSAGWATAGVTGDPRLARFGLDVGFDSWQDAAAWGAMPSLWAPVAAAGLDLLDWPRHVPADEVAARAVDVMKAQSGGGWLLVVHLVDAGGPMLATPDDLAAVGATTRPWPMDRYRAAVRGVDRAIGTLVDAAPPEAWVVVVGDRGVELGEMRAGATVAQPGLRFGHSMYEELLRVPMVIHRPGGIPSVVSGGASLIDIAPTLTVGLDLPKLPRTDGAPLGPVFGERLVPHDLVAQSSRFGPEQQAVIRGHYKLVHTAAGRSPMFDLRLDASEVSSMPTRAESDTLERELLGVLPPPGAGATLHEPPRLILRLGQLASRFTGR